MVADCIPTLTPPFPGDHLYCIPDLHPEIHFFIQQDEEMCDYLLCDQLTGVRLVLAQCLMEHPNFDICHWYAKQRAHELGLTNEITHHCCMVKPYP